MCSHMCMCVRVCARVCARVISGLKHLLRIFSNPFDAYTLFSIQNPQFMACGTIYLYFCSQETWRNEKRLIAQLNHDCQTSLTRGGTWLHLIR